jgi:hypothetical protein
VAPVDVVADALVGELEEVAGIVEQRRHHQRRIRLRSACERGGLERVLELGDLLVVALGPPALEQVEHLADRPRRAHRHDLTAPASPGSRR